ncbi:MAG TPA: hypothetical protein VD967_02880 [Candidatus Paceibacterota bacterium]|nr:hypothetical protein [Candidatus Paceibacterota bacterium]
MNEGTESQRDQIIRNLEELNERVENQASVWYVLRNGIIYGAGFIIGSTVLTALAVSIVLFFFEDTLLGDVILWIAGR